MSEKTTFVQAIALALQYGYTKHYSAGTKEVWTKQDESGVVLFLTLNAMEADQVILERYVGLIQCKLGPFSFPHKLFERWEQELINLAPANLPNYEMPIPK